MPARIRAPKQSGVRFGRRLDGHVGTEDQPRAGDRPLQLVERRVRRVRHPRARLGPEVLDDDLLDVAELVVQIAQREQRFDALFPGLADPDQDAGRVGNRELSRHPHRRQPRVGILVRRAVVGVAGLEQSPGDALQHHPLRGADLAQGEQLVARHHARIGVRQQAGGLEHRAGGGHQVGDRRRVAQRVQLGARLRIAQLRLVPQREERFPAARLGAPSRHVDDLVEGHVRPLARPRRLGERAVVAHVATQLGEGDEHLPRVAHGPPEPRVAQLGGAPHESGEVGLMYEIESRPARGPAVRAGNHHSPGRRLAAARRRLYHVGTGPETAGGPGRRSGTNVVSRTPETLGEAPPSRSVQM